jgi:hypothetical protein
MDRKKSFDLLVQQLFSNTRFNDNTAVYQDGVCSGVFYASQNLNPVWLFKADFWWIPDFAGIP